ncbi:hypothetical protein SSP35_11_01410 [Streptomyces sp. NBRC 110611]|uniref:hypothetical protein n=1 Tax=Streptomyces sp. NBRC 110611 TaxID=1621259 RepID=UPI00082DA5A9|nr:hypothetical protein [Streptomyces sp. NBRC 110611]GAU69322.1 hypothetical protein SSP35_11_01410 [Streptomyces sp. NBRC 110611]
MATGDVNPSGVFSIELGGWEVETVQNVTLPTHSQPGEFTIIRGLDRSPLFTAWVDAGLQTKSLKRKRRTDRGSTHQEVITVLEYDSEYHEFVARHCFIHARASSRKPLEEDASNAEPATEVVTIAYEDYTVELPG